MNEAMLFGAFVMAATSILALLILPSTIRRSELEPVEAAAGAPETAEGVPAADLTGDERQRRAL
jgi:hypothetical protein